MKGGEIMSHIGGNFIGVNHNQNETKYSYTVQSVTGTNARSFIVKRAEKQYLLYVSSKDGSCTYNWNVHIEYPNGHTADSTKTLSTTGYDSTYNAHCGNDTYSNWDLSGNDTPIFSEDKVKAIKNFIENGDISGADNYADLILPEVYVDLTVENRKRPNTYIKPSVTYPQGEIDGTVDLYMVSGKYRKDIPETVGSNVTYEECGDGFTSNKLNFYLKIDINVDGSTETYIYGTSCYINKMGVGSAVEISTDGKLHLTLTVKDTDKISDSDKYTDNTTNTDRDTTNVTPNYNQYSPVTTLTKTYQMTDSQLRQLGNRLWNETMFDDWNLLNESPMDNIVSCLSMPISMSGTDETIVIGNINMQTQGTKITNPVYRNTFTLPSISIPRRYYNWLDYDETTISLHLPYIGFKTLDTRQFMGNPIKVDYVFDCITGMCEALVFFQDSETKSWIMAHRFGGIAGIQIPLNSRNNSDWMSAIGSNLLGSVAGIGVGLATGGAGLALGGMSAISSLGKSTTEKRTTDSIGSPSPMCSSAIDNSIYLIIERPKVKIPKNYAHNVGWNCQYNSMVSDVVGYAQMSNFDLSGIPCLEEERKLIDSILKSGFYGRIK